MLDQPHVATCTCSECMAWCAEQEERQKAIQKEVRRVVKHLERVFERNLSDEERIRIRKIICVLMEK